MDILSEILLPVVKEAKKTIPSASTLDGSADAPLFGNGGLDSLGLVRFIVMVEERIDDVLDKEVTLASDKAMSRKSSPFATLGALSEWIQECLEEA